MVASEADDTDVESTPLVSGRAVSTTSRAGSSVHIEGLADASATSDKFSHYPDQQSAALRAAEVKRLAEHIPDRYARLLSKDVRVLKRDNPKTLPKQA